MGQSLRVRFWLDLNGIEKSSSSFVCICVVINLE